MKTKMKSTLCGFLLILVLVEVLYCQGCWNNEREALLALNAQFDTSFPGVEGTDCCQWERVECNSTTRRVAKLDLSSAWDNWDEFCNLNYTDFLVFEDLKSLNLASNNIAECVENEGPRLNNLEVLDLSGNSLNNSTGILSCVDGFSSLKSLNLASNLFSGATSFHAFQTLSSKLLNLEVLDVSYNHLSSDFLPSLGGFKSLKNLDLSMTELVPELHIQGALISPGDKVNNTLSLAGLFSKLINLEVLNISYNDFNGSDITSDLSGLSSLKSLTLRGSGLTLESILSISKLCTLGILDLSGNQLNDSNLWSLEKEGFAWPINLRVLVLIANRLSNNILSSVSGLQYLKSLDLRGNELEGSLNISGLLALSHLKKLDLSWNNINSLVHQGSRSLSSLEVLALDGNEIDGSMLRKSLTVFPSIRVLSLTENQFKGTVVAADFRDLNNLEHLLLDRSFKLVNDFFKSIGALTSLKVLSLAACGINGTLPVADFFELKMLEELNLSENEFEGPLPPSFADMSSLRMLDLSSNHFSGNFGSNLASLTSLEYLDFGGNQFEVPISFKLFANYSSLKFINADGNKAILDLHPSLKAWVPKFQLQELYLSLKTKAKSLPLPNFLLYQYNLTHLDFTGSRFGGEFPNWLLENNTKLIEFVLASCSFTGTFKLPSSPLVSLSMIDASDNAITGQIPCNNISSIFPFLEHLNMSFNDIQGSIPHEFGQMRSLNTLDLSDNYFSGEIPKNISGTSSMLSFMKLSHNNLGGPVFPTLPRLTQLVDLFLDGNSFSGSIIFNISSLMEVLDISNNHFVGKLPSRGIEKLSSLTALSMSNNHFEGSIPPELVELGSLHFLDLSQNNLMGSIPSFLKSAVVFIHLSNNKLCELPKRMFNESSAVSMLDLSYNQIAKSIKDIIQDLNNTMLSILLLNDNHFSGQIPKQLCQLNNLNILDLSHNNVSGPIPSCLGRMPFDYPNDEWVLLGDGDEAMPLPFVHEKANFTTKKRSYTYMGDVLVGMSGIDLSYNRLNGTIPSELGNLTKIRALNLSHNDLTGKISATFSNLAQIESLDLSFNNLSGNIPPQLNELTFLVVFSVAHNNLSGATPEMKRQFSTFDESSYEGNPFLCGPPLPKSCNPNEKPHGILQNGTDTDGDNGSLLDMYIFWVSFAVSYTSVLLAIVAALYINPYWRRAWFYHVELVSTNCYYFIEDNLWKLSNIGNM